MSESNILGTTVVTQIGILVNDIEKTAGVYAEFLGVEKPDIVLTGDYDDARTEYLAQPSRARAKLAFFKVGPNVDIELIEPDEEPSTWRNDLDERGEGFHHVAFVVNGMKEKIVALQASGMPLLQKGEYPGGRYAYVDAKEKLKLILELLENDLA